MIVIQAIINQSDIKTKSIPIVLSCIIILLDCFEFKSFHILCEHNTVTNKCAKHGNNLDEGVIEVNGVFDFLLLP